MSNIRQAATNRIGLAEHLRNVWVYTATIGTQIDDLLVPAYWQMIARANLRLNPWDLIEVREESGAWWIEALVKHVSPEGIEVAFIKGVQTENMGPKGAAKPIAGDLNVRYKGPHHKWSACRGEEVLKDGFETQELASVWVTNYSKTSGATTGAAA